LEDNEDAAMKMPEDSPHLKWWEESERKAEEEEDEMLKEQETLLESFVTARIYLFLASICLYILTCVVLPSNGEKNCSSLEKVNHLRGVRVETRFNKGYASV
jgi:hypothetical protein